MLVEGLLGMAGVLCGPYGIASGGRNRPRLWQRPVTHLSRLSLNSSKSIPRSTAGAGIFIWRHMAIVLVLCLFPGLVGCLEQPAGEVPSTPTAVALVDTATPTASPTQTPTNSPTSTLVATSTTTFTPTSSRTPSPAPTETPVPTYTPTSTTSPTTTPSPSYTPTPTATSTPTVPDPTATPLPASPSPTSSATASPTLTPTPVVEPTATATSTGVTTRDPVESLPPPPRRAIAVVISNDPEAIPQSGLLEADIVYEAPAEFSLTRLIPIFLTNSPEKVGPIRSTRSYYVGLAAEYGGGLAHCLDVPSVPPIFEDTDAFSLDGCRGLAAEAFFRDDERLAPWNLYVDVSLLERHVPDSGYWGPMALRSRLAEGSRISEAALTFVKGHHVEWTYRSGRYYRRQNNRRHMDSSGRQLAADVVLVQMVVTRDTSYFGEAGYHEVDVVDEGEGYILAGGRMMELRWSRQRLDGITKWTSLAGQPVHIPRGQVWVEIMPIGSEVVFREPRRPYSPLDPSISSLSFFINRDLRLAALFR